MAKLWHFRERTYKLPLPSAPPSQWSYQTSTFSSHITAAKSLALAPSPATNSTGQQLLSILFNPTAIVPNPVVSQGILLALQGPAMELYIKAQQGRMWCSCCRWWLHQKQRPTVPLALFVFFNTHTHLIRRWQPLLSKAPLQSCLDHTEIWLLHCILQVLGSTSYCIKHQQAGFHTRSPQHVHLPTGCKDWYESAKPLVTEPGLAQRPPSSCATTAAHTSSSRQERRHFLTSSHCN